MDRHFPAVSLNERHMYVLEIGNIVKSIKIFIANVHM